MLCYSDEGRKPIGSREKNLKLTGIAEKEEFETLKAN